MASMDRNALSHWIALYWNLHVKGAPPKTVKAKQQDIGRFVVFFREYVGTDAVNDWTPAVSKEFAGMLKSALSQRSKKPLKPATVCRILATLRTFGRWLHKERPLLAGMPFAGVKPPSMPQTAARGLSSRQIMRVKMACDQRMGSCKRKIQQPRLERAVFMVLLHTGLREHELVRLNLDQYDGSGFTWVKRKGSRVDQRVALPTEAAEALDAYLDHVRGRDQAEGPLLISRRGTRLSVRGLAYICERLAKQASLNLPEAQRFGMPPHILRHTYLKKMADKRGIHYAQRVSGNANVREIFRYAAPSEAEIQEAAEGLFDGSSGSG